MKRKRNNEPVTGVKKRKSSDNYNGFSEKTLLDFWAPKQKKESKKRIKSKSKSKSRSDSKDSQRSSQSSQSSQSKTMQLVKNPSKQCLKGPTITQNILDYKKKILFNEDFVRKFKIILEPFFGQLKFSLIKQFDNLIEEDLCEKFIANNIDNILTKFLLQINDDFLFVPISYMNRNESSVDKHKLKLLEGFNDLKYISLQYQPIKAKEILNEDLANNLTAYLRHFNKRRKKNGGGKASDNGNKNRKAFVIQHSDYIELIKTIEVICNDQDYKIIRLDELENQKMNKLNKISEATQSQRLSALPEALNEKLKILDRIVSNNNNNQKLSLLLNQNADFPELYVSHSMPNSLTPTTATTGESITHYFTQDTKERNIYNIIQDNVYRICAKKKTLILIVDSFKGEEDKSYLNGIINKISMTKCPIIILTNNLDFAKIDNNFNNSSKTINNNFLFYQVDSNTKLSQQKSLCLVSLVLFLHTMVKDHLECILQISNDESSNELGNEVTNILNEKMKNIFTKEMLAKFTDEKIFDRITKIALKISLSYEYKLESIFSFIYNALRFGEFSTKLDPESLVEKLNMLSVHFKQCKHEFDREEELESLLKKIENVSFNFYLEDKEEVLADKIYNSFYYEVNRQNEKIFKNVAITKKDPLVNRNNDQLVNCEKVLLSQFLNKKNESDSTFTFYKKYFNEKLFERTSELNKEDKFFYGSLYGNKFLSIQRNNVHELNSLFDSFNNLDYENFLILFGIRKPRSTRKLVKEKDINAMNEESKMNAFSKLFRGINANLLERYLNIHDYNSNILQLSDDEYYVTPATTSYFTSYKIYEEIRTNELANLVNHTSSGEDCSYISEEEEFDDE